MLALKIAEGDAAIGARAAYESLPLSAFEPQFARLGIECDTRELVAPKALFQRALGEMYASLPAELRYVHNGNLKLVMEGEADIDAGTAIGSWLIRRLFRLPETGADLPVRVEITPSGRGEIWRRQFGSHKFHTRLSAPRTPRRSRVSERFGPLTCALDLSYAEGKLHYAIAGANFLGIPLPRRYWPRVSASEFARGERFHFDVRIDLPIFGMLLHYRGWLMQPCDAPVGSDPTERVLVSNDTVWPG